jgi:hypothetical protein
MLAVTPYLTQMQASLETSNCTRDPDLRAVSRLATLLANADAPPAPYHLPRTTRAMYTAARRVPRLLRALHIDPTPAPPTTAIALVPHARDAHSTHAGTSTGPGTAGASAPAETATAAAADPQPHARADTLWDAAPDMPDLPSLAAAHLPVPRPLTPGTPEPDPASARAPFDTHRFVRALERCFPTRTAEGFMHATRAVLGARLARARAEALTGQDVENVRRSLCVCGVRG